MEQIKAYKFRMYPTNEQRILINKTFGCARYLYNYFLNKKQELYKTNKKSLSAFDCIKEIPELSKEREWLKEIDSCALRCSIFDLDDAFKNFFAKRGSYPHFKAKHGKNSYRTNNITNEYKGRIYNSIKLDLKNRLLTLPKLKAVKIRGYRNLEFLNGRIINVTITKENNRYYTSIVVEEPNMINETNATSIVGIDLGIKSLITTSDNEVYQNQKVTKKYEKRLAHIQRELARKIKGSKNYYKCKARLNTIYRKIKNTRKHYLHDITKKLTDTYRIIVTEKLSIKEMVKDSKLAKNILDVTWYELIRQLEYKSEKKNVKFYQINPYYPSTQKCSSCGEKNERMKSLTIREYQCNHCHNKLDRDYNAALNIMSEGLDRYIEELAI